MNPQDEAISSELESFRQQWLLDLRSRTQQSNAAAASPHGPSSVSKDSAGGRTRGPGQSFHHGDDDGDFPQSRAFDEPAPLAGHTLAASAQAQDSQQPKQTEPVTALDYYEEAMQRESEGNMGESLRLYRRAYRLDNGVDRRYREKFFPQGAPSVLPKPVSPTQQHAKPSAPARAESHQKQPAPSIPQPPPSSAVRDGRPLEFGDLITSFAGLKIEPSPPPVEGMPPLQCPIASIPDEILVHILQDVAAADPADFVRLALVCRRLAYLVATEDRPWRTVSLRPEFGFPGMHYHYQLGVEWQELDDFGAPEEQTSGSSSRPQQHRHQKQHRRLSSSNDTPILSHSELTERRYHESQQYTRTLVPSLYPTWKAMFRYRPRIRFNGCYISTVNYVRAGQASTNQATWGGSPIHIVTYYRYLRFFRDGSVISLLTTSEPAHVVHYITPHNLHLHRDLRNRDRAHASQALPSAPMHLALKGRWRLADPALGPEREGELAVETEGVAHKYTYLMGLNLGTTGKAARNNKITWKGFHSYNKLIDDWAELPLKNEKPYFFSRVKSYGFGF